MAQHLLIRAMNAALSAFNAGKQECRIHGIILQIVHAHHDNYQVLLPNKSEIFRIVGRPLKARIFAN